MVNAYKRKYLERIPICTAKAVESENFRAFALAVRRVK